MRRHGSLAIDKLHDLRPGKSATMFFADLGQVGGGILECHSRQAAPLSVLAMTRSTAPHKEILALGNARFVILRNAHDRLPQEKGKA